MSEQRVGDNTNQRLAEVEREYRRLRRFTLALMIGFAILLGLGTALTMVSSRYGLPGTVAKIVAAEQFVLRGHDGAVRGFWGTEKNGTLRMVFQDGAERPRVKLNLLNDGSSGLTFSDSAGRARTVFALLPDQSTSIVFADEAGKTRMVLGMSPGGAATLVFADRDGATRAGLGVDRGGAGGLTLLDRNGRELTQSDAPAAEVAETASTPDREASPPAGR